MLRISLLSCLLLSSIIIMTNATAIGEKQYKFKDSKISRIQPLIPFTIESRDVSEHKLFGNENQYNQFEKHQEVQKNNGKKQNGKKINNSELLETLGLAKLQVPPSHHRKRLAVESRHHSRPDDSHMFVIKLPPNPYYYSFTKPIGSEKNSIDDMSKKISVGFKSNGKPGRIYHWNIPVLKKMFGTTHGRNPNSRNSDDDSELFDIKNIPTWSQSSSSGWENETVDKKSAYSKLSNDKILKKKSPTYYAPKSRNTNFHKYFPGNGKPQSFYVIEKSHKPAHYHKLIS